MRFGALARDYLGIAPSDWWYHGNEFLRKFYRFRGFSIVFVTTIVKIRFPPLASSHPKHQTNEISAAK